MREGYLLSENPEVDDQTFEGVYKINLESILRFKAQVESRKLPNSPHYF